MNDAELHSVYVTQRSEEAFATLVERHVSLVFSSALRQVRDPHLAEEITQAVFIILARKAAQLKNETVLAGWLCRTARFASRNALKAEHRRQHREQEAHLQSLLTEIEPDAWPQIAPLLDEAVAQLGETDRNAIVARYYQQKPLDEVGRMLGVNAGTAQKRVARALEKLRKIFVKRRVKLTAAVIAGAVAANSVQGAPAGLAATVTAATIKGAATGSSTLTIIKGTLKLMTWAKLKIAALAGIGVLLVSATAIIAVETRQPTPPDPAAVEKIFDLYSQALALSGPGTEDAGPAAAVHVMSNHPPMALIRRSPSRQPGQRPAFGSKRLTGVIVREGHVGLFASVGEVIRYTDDLDLSLFPQNRIIVPLESRSDPHYEDRFDYVDTMPQGGKEVLRRALKDQFGLVARREMRGNLLLTVKNSSTGLHQHADDGTNPTDRTVNVTMPKLAAKLSKLLGVEVTDQTGLAGGFDYTLNPRSPSTDDTIAAIREQLGLELVPAADHQQIEFIVVEKVR